MTQGFCSFSNGYGIGHRDPEVQYRCAVASILANPKNEPSATRRATTQDLLANRTRLTDSEIDRASLILDVSHKWQPGRTIKVGFIDGPEWARQQVLEISSRWTKYANLEVVLETNLSAADERITFASGGSWAMLGTGALGVKNGPTVQLGWYLSAPAQGVVLHEAGHWVIAAPHEQFHPERHCEYDRSAVIADLSKPPNSWSIRMIEGNVLRPPWAGDTYTPYDIDSIMHYEQPQRWFITPNCAVGANHELSRLDKRGAHRWYPGRVRGLAQELLAPLGV